MKFTKNNNRRGCGEKREHPDDEDSWGVLLGLGRQPEDECEAKHNREPGKGDDSNPQPVKQ